MGRMHEEVLPGNTAAVAAALAEWPVLGHFYLAGGTALALHVGHRQSGDLDMFTREPVERLPELVGIDEMLARFAHVRWDLHTPEQTQWHINDVSVTLLAYPFAHRFSHHSWRGLAVADPRDIAIQKAYTIGRRAQARDYLDLHAILSRGLLSLDDLMRYAQDTYGEAFSARLFLQQLTYTRDLPDRDSALTLLVSAQSFDTIADDLAYAVRTWAAHRFAASGPDAPGQS